MTQTIDDKKLRKSLLHNVGEAIADYQMIGEGDKIMVCLSGGKDSYTLLDLLLHFQRVAPIKFELVAVNLDQKQPGFPEQTLPDYLKQLNVPFHIIEKDTYSIVKEKIPAGQTMCALCSRLRRGLLYSFATKIGANKLALGHHRDDIIETFFLNMFHGGRLKAMPPKLLNDEQTHIVIRPLAYCSETLVAQWSKLQRHPIIPCTLCGSQENLQRKVLKNMLQNWEQQTPGRLDQIMRSLKNISPSQLADSQLFDFKNLEALAKPAASAQTPSSKNITAPASPLHSSH